METDKEALVACRDLWKKMIVRIRRRKGGNELFHELKNQILIELGYGPMNWGCPMCEYDHAIFDCERGCLLFDFWEDCWDGIESFRKMCERSGSPYMVARGYFEGRNVTRKQAQGACKEIAKICEEKLN